MEKEILLNQSSIRMLILHRLTTSSGEEARLWFLLLGEISFVRICKVISSTGFYTCKFLFLLVPQWDETLHYIGCWFEFIGN